LAVREQSGVGLGIGITLVLFLVLLPFLIVVSLYTFFSIYAMTKGTAFSAPRINLEWFLGGVAVITAVLGILLMVIVSLIGRQLGFAFGFRRRRGARRGNEA
jgi:hypothetical protein